MSDWLELVRRAERHFDQRQFAQAACLAEQSLQQNPNLALAHQVLGLVCSETEAPEKAIPRLTKAVALRPDLVPSHNGLGRCYSMLGDAPRALLHYETALRLQPDHAYARFNRAMTLLKLGRFREGWLDYEWRYRCGQVQRPEVPRPRWDGSPPAGRAIMVHTEQGLGDVLQFVRLLPLLRRQNARIVFACQKALHVLLRPLPDVDEWFPIDEPGAITFDVYTSLLSLPGWLELDEATIPREVPYLHLDAERVARWRTVIGGLPGCKVGLAWQGSPTLRGDSQRSIALSHFAPLAAVPGVTLVSLQKGAGVEQIESQRDTVPVTTFDDLDHDAPFMDTAAILQHLDLVITVDSSVAHLAGALGRPVWLLLSTGCDWRWQTQRTDTPWYPTMRLFRQQSLGDWTPLFEEVAAALHSHANTQAGRVSEEPS